MATAFPKLTQEFFTAAGQSIKLVPVSGAAEIAPHLGVAEVIVDLVSTGSTLKVNGLKELATVLDSSALLVSRPAAQLDGESQKQIRELVVAKELALVLERRAESGDKPGSSYTATLLADRNLRLKKLAEEAGELALACADGDPSLVAEEAADLLYHALVASRAGGVRLEDILAVLHERRRASKEKE